MTAPEPLAAKTQLDRSSREASPHALAVEVLLQELNASSAGLSSAEACRRLEKFGLNRLPPPYRYTPIRIDSVDTPYDRRERVRWLLYSIGVVLFMLLVLT